MSKSEICFFVKRNENSPRVVDAHGVIVEDVSNFLSALESRGLSPHTLEAYCYDLLLLYRWLGERQFPHSPSVENLEYRDLLDFIRNQQANKHRATSINRRLVVIGQFYVFVTGHHLGGNPGTEKGVSLPAPHYKGRGRDRELGLHLIKAPQHRSLRVKVPRTVVEPLTTDQVRQLIRSFRRYRDLVIVYMMLMCGLRSREVLALEVGDVDIQQQRLRVTGKGNKERVLPLPARLLEFTTHYLRLERPSFCRSRKLFVVMQGHRRGEAMTPSGLRSLFRQRRHEQALENANPHRLRHTFGADMARAGVRLHTLQKLMGHEDSKTTLRYINLSMADVADEFHRASRTIRARYEKPEKERERHEQ